MQYTSQIPVATDSGFMHRRDDYGGLLQTILDLPDRDKFSIYLVLRSYLSEVFTTEDPISRQVQARQDALAALHQVFEHLGLQPGAPLRTSDFDEAATELNLSMRNGQVIRAFGRWKNALLAAHGERTPLTVGQRSLIRAARNGPRKSATDFLRDVKVWLDTNPETTYLKDYKEFQADFNSRLSEGERPLIHSDTIARYLGVGWQRIVAMARDELDPAAARQLAKNEGAEKYQSPLIANRGVAFLLDRRSEAVRLWVKKESFPRPVAQLNGTDAWRRSDIEAFRDGRPFSKRVDYSEQEQFVDRKEILKLTGLHPRHQQRFLWEENWDRLPKPEGRLGQSYYWRRTAVEKWLREKEKSS